MLPDDGRKYGERHVRAMFLMSYIQQQYGYQCTSHLYYCGIAVISKEISER